MKKQIIWTVQVVSGDPNRPANIRPERFASKREALAFIRATPHNFISRVGQTYTIYPRKVKK